MRPKFLLLALVLFLVYLMGARAGQDRYESIVRNLTKYWNDPKVKKARKKARKARGKALKAARKRMAG